MSHFKAKMHQIRFRLILSRMPAGELPAPARPPSWISSVLLLREERKGNKGKEVKVRERKGKGRGKGRTPNNFTPQFRFSKKHAQYIWFVSSTVLKRLNLFKSPLLINMNKQISR